MQRIRLILASGRAGGLGVERRKVRRVGDQIGTHILRQIERVALRVGHHERGPRLIDLQFGVGLHHLRTVVRAEAKRQDPVSPAGDRVGQHRIVKGNWSPGYLCEACCVKKCLAWPAISTFKDHLRKSATALN